MNSKNSEFKELEKKLNEAYLALLRDKNVAKTELLINEITNKLDGFESKEDSNYFLDYLYMLRSNIAIFIASTGKRSLAISILIDLAKLQLEFAKETRERKHFKHVNTTVRNAGMISHQRHLEDTDCRDSENIHELFNIVLMYSKQLDDIAELQFTRRIYAKFLSTSGDKEKLNLIHTELLQTFSEYRIIPDSGGDIEKHMEMIMDEENMNRRLRTDLRSINYESALGQYEYGKYLCEKGESEKGIGEMKSALFIIGYLHVSAQDMLIYDQNYLPDINEIEKDIARFEQDKKS
ncbi:hypothetical protein SLH46_21265 [Draconibacterium sp. IB214405]|uniref:hypothetical protein n=1 Tax=Draconibacterium sp. IB214405 TaxID=3097352 RepID=UPI002A134A7F|nr:hypothetical protein [Draconibacterium sp. IB214405]MDX8341743.1 hypothetical protein [Draconibacterium sp. IB214405]